MTTAVAVIGASWAVWNVSRLWHVVPPLGTFARSLVVCAIAFGVAVYWHMPGLLVLLKLPTMVVGCLALFVGLGEFTPHEIATVRAVLTKGGH